MGLALLNGAMLDEQRQRGSNTEILGFTMTSYDWLKILGRIAQDSLTIRPERAEKTNRKWPRIRAHT